MANEVIRQVAEMEENTKKMLENTAAEGKQQILEAQRAARQLLETSRQEAEGEARQMMADAERQAAVWTEEALASARTECEEMKARAQDKLDQAAAFLMEKVVNI